MKHLYGNYFLTTDKLNYIITERSIVKGSEKFRDKWFYTSIPQLLTGIQERLVLENMISKDLDKVIAELQTLRDIIYNE